MTAKQWLNRGWRIQQEIEILNETKADLFDRLTHITASYNGMPGAATPDPHKFDEYAAYCEVVDGYCRQLANTQAEIVSVIEQIPDGNCRRLLTCRYVEFLTWEQVAVKLHYSWRHTMRLHGEALRMAHDVIECHIGRVLD